MFFLENFRHANVVNGGIFRNWQKSSSKKSSQMTFSAPSKEKPLINLPTNKYINAIPRYSMDRSPLHILFGTHILLQKIIWDWELIESELVNLSLKQWNELWHVAKKKIAKNVIKLKVGQKQAEKSVYNVHGVIPIQQKQLCLQKRRCRWSSKHNDLCRPSRPLGEGWHDILLNTSKAALHP